jgi:hypothetical protein
MPETTSDVQSGGKQPIAQRQIQSKAKNRFYHHSLLSVAAGNIL